ncbi:3-methyladenine DNA glycosylase [Agyrium rufum]|nr:3-methyladenine DNA glycosylase [Agyrium rufum]
MSTARITRSSLKASNSISSTQNEATLPTRGMVTTSKPIRKRSVKNGDLPPITAPKDPATPPPSKRLKRTETVTPAQVKLMVAPYSSGDIDDATPPASPSADRPVEPHTTNATLKTPRGSKLTAYKASVRAEDISPSKAHLPPPTSTTGALLEEACAHLIRVDPRLKPVIEKHQCHVFSPAGLAEETDPFRSLVSGIMAQQVSGAAAKSIKNKFVALFDPETMVFPTPEKVAEAEIPFLRTAGLSQRKAEYVKGLAEKFASGELSAKMLIEADYEEVIEKLTAVRGLGLWSVEMFACFALKRMDVFSTGDLGVQRGMAALDGKDIKKLKAKGGGKFKYMSEKEMLEKAEKFAPYR